MGFIFVPKQQVASDAIMTIAKDIGFHLNDVSDNPFNGKTACVDLWINTLNYHSFSSVCWLCHQETGLAEFGTGTPAPRQG